MATEHGESPETPDAHAHESAGDSGESRPDQQSNPPSLPEPPSLEDQPLIAPPLGNVDYLPPSGGDLLSSKDLAGPFWPPAGTGGAPLSGARPVSPPDYPDRPSQPSGLLGPPPGPPFRSSRGGYDFPDQQGSGHAPPGPPFRGPAQGGATARPGDPDSFLDPFVAASSALPPAPAVPPAPAPYLAASLSGPVAAQASTAPPPPGPADDLRLPLLRRLFGRTRRRS